MGGRRTAFEDLIITAAKMPWQAGLVLALLSFIGLHILAVHFASPLSASDKAHIDALVTHTFLATVAPLADHHSPGADSRRWCLGLAPIAGVSPVRQYRAYSSEPPLLVRVRAARRGAVSKAGLCSH